MKSFFSKLFSYLYLEILVFAIIVSTNINLKGTCSTDNNIAANCIRSISGCEPRSYYGTRSPGANTARELIGWQEFIYQYPENPCQAYGAFAVATEYQRTFKPDRIAQYLFCTDTLRFVGSQVENRGDGDIVAENFGLPSNFNQSLKVNPKIENYIFDFEWFLGLNNWSEGLYFRAHAPVVYSRWSLFDKKCQKYEDSPTAIAGAYGILDSSPLSNVPVLGSLQEALKGAAFGAMTEQWTFGRFSFCEVSKVRLADIDLIVGQNFWDCRDSHVGLFLQVVVPTGNKNDATYVFSPVIGNGSHWEAGAGLSAHTMLWDGCGDQSLSVYFEGNATHMFKNHQTRSFDFKNNGPLSRYLLLKEIGVLPTTANPSQTPPIPATAATTNGFNGTLINAINVNTRNVTVSVAIKGDASIKFAYRNCNLGVDLGYNIYGQTHENVSILNGPPSSVSKFNPNTAFVIQGGQPTQGFVACTGETLGDTPVVISLNSGQPNATIFNNNSGLSADQILTKLEINPGGSDINNAGIIAANPSIGMAIDQSYNLTNTCMPGEDRVVLTPAGLSNLGTNTIIPAAANLPAAYVATATVGTAPVPGSFTYSDINVLNIRSGTAKSILTHKLFGFINYKMAEETAFIGVGGELEFDGSYCRKGGHNQWGLIIKGGFTF